MLTAFATLLAFTASAVTATEAHAATGTTYYVDSRTGSDSNDGTNPGDAWKTLAKVDAASLRPGDTIAFQGGETWTGGLTITSSGTAAAPITVTSYGTGRAIIAGQDTVQAAVTLADVHDVHLTGLEVTNGLNQAAPTSVNYRGIYVVAQDTGNMPGIVVSNNYVHDIDGAGGSDIGQGGIVVGVRGNTTPTWFSDLQITGNEVAHVNAYGISTFTTWCADCDIYSTETGIPTSEVSATRQPYTNPLIANNYVHSVTGGGITPEYADNAVVENNTVDMAASNRLVTTGGGNVGIWWQGTDNILVQYNTVLRTAVNDLNPDATDDMAFDADMGSTGSTVQYNYSDSNSGGFFMCLISATDITLRYNISQSDHFRPFSIWSGCSGFRGYNNTVWSTTTTVPRNNGSGGTTQQGIEAMVRDAAPYNNVLFDNIFYNPSNAPYQCGSSCFNGPDSSMDYSHNLYWDGSAASTVVPANDPAPVVADPQLSSPGDAAMPTGALTTAQLQQTLAGYASASGSAARNAGVSASTAPPSDLFGTPVPAGAPDLGAWQHPVTATASTTLGTGSGSIADITDGDPTTSWASADSPAFPGTVTVNYGEARTMDAVTLVTAFGQGQGATSVDVQTWNGSGWTTQVSSHSLTWRQNTAAAEWLRIPLPAPVTTTGVRLVIHSANLTWGHLAVYELRPTFGAAASSGLGVLSGTVTGDLVNDTGTGSWASQNSPKLPGAVQIDPGAEQTVSSVTLAAAFGQGQGPTSVSIEANPGGVWQQVLAPTTVTWNTSSSTVETRSLTLTTPVTATQFRIVVNSANLTWGHVALNQITLQ
ncbi:discoidin domain-containing protein [Streptomyces sp. PTM05]|uniref:Discoidin domain-containing protein n=1 Tax=Streptantibioticus parmotrematis TaxID=2873249 RepID=A0ABS7QPZ5_9ACTN|nr:discoidin domain-containing protein [Streptantibioticus parmotrematis]MBY8885266.1 discoidin domain-containing protein [Streptantibioticus parmotrematis]